MTWHDLDNYDLQLAYFNIGKIKYIKNYFNLFVHIILHPFTGRAALFTDETFLFTGKTPLLTKMQQEMCKQFCIQSVKRIKWDKQTKTHIPQPFLSSGPTVH